MNFIQEKTLKHCGGKKNHQSEINGKNPFLFRCFTGQNKRSVNCKFSAVIIFCHDVCVQRHSEGVAKNMMGIILRPIHCSIPCNNLWNMYILGIERNKLEWFNNDRFMEILTWCFLDAVLSEMRERHEWQFLFFYSSDCITREDSPALHSSQYSALIPNKTYN